MVFAGTMMFSSASLPLAAVERLTFVFD